MIVIVEGCDLSGKTTAIERISKYFNSGFTLKNNFKPKNIKDTTTIYNQYWDILELLKFYTHNKSFRDKEKLIILDRFYPSQAVYSYLRGTDEMLSSYIITLDKYCKKKNIVYIYLDTDIEILRERYRERGDEHISIKDLEKLKKRYDKFYKLTNLSKIKIDTTDIFWLDEVEKFLNKRGFKK